MNSANDDDLGTPFERSLRAMAPRAERPHVDQLLFEAGKAAGRSTASRTYRRALAGLGLLCVLLTSAIVCQRATQQHAIAALRDENLRLAQALRSFARQGRVPEVRRRQEGVTSLAADLYRHDSVLSSRYAHVQLRDRLARDDPFLRPLYDRREQPPNVSDPHWDGADFEPSSFGRLQMQQQWLQGGPPRRGDAT
jgi:hypothetical protein